MASKVRKLLDGALDLGADLADSSDVRSRRRASSSAPTSWRGDSSEAAQPW